MTDTLTDVAADFEYVGNWQTPIPSALVLDTRLLPSEKLVWMAIRCTQMRPDSVTKQTYDYLQTCCNLSRPTIAKALKALQLTGWMHAKRQHTDGWIESTRYSMFDCDQSERFVKNPDFMIFVRTCLDQETRLLHIVHEFAKRFGFTELADISSQKIELRQNSGGKKFELPSSKEILLPEFGSSKKFELLGNVDFPSSKEIELPRVRDVVSSSSTTTAGERAGARELVWPMNLSDAAKQQNAVGLAMLDPDKAQQVLDELSAQMARGVIKNPTSYLYRLVSNVAAGTFAVTDAGERVTRSRLRHTASVQEQADRVSGGNVVSLLTVSAEVRNLWRSIGSALEAELGREVVELWIRPLIVREVSNELVLFGANDLVASKVEQWLPRIEELVLAGNPTLDGVRVAIGDGVAMERAS